MDTQTVLWILGALIGILTTVIGALCMALWALYRMMTEFRLHVANEYHNSEDVEALLQRVLEPIRMSNNTILERLKTLESAVHAQHGHQNHRR
jgi:hypothetical protein